MARSICSLVLPLMLLLETLTLGGGAPARPAFPDVRPGDWFYRDVTEMADSGVVVGLPDGTFAPNRTVTAGEFVSIAARRAGVGRAGAAGHWAEGWVSAARERRWFDYDELPPVSAQYDQPLSRALAVKIVMNAFLPDARGEYSTWAPRIRDFSDLSGRYYEPVFAAYQTGVAVGMPDGSFQPNAHLTRAEACALVCRAARISQTPQPTPGETVSPVIRSGGVSENGKLQVVGTQLCGEDGQPVVLRGMSSHGLQWYGGFTSRGAIETTAHYGANLFRIAMYTGENGYLSDPEGIKQKVIAAADAALASDLYAIIDWHILSDGNPMDHVTEAEAFFTEMALRYRDEPGILFEICNEPNGPVTWKDHVKPYAQRLVRAIRQTGSEAVILIGSPTWSQDVDQAAADPVSGENLMYTLHFYAGTHGAWLRDRAQAALEQGLPLFVTEWGVSDASGSGGVFQKEAEQWLDFLNEHRISWANWSLCDKDETSAALRPGASPEGGWQDKDLSASGQFVFGRFHG